MEQEKLYWTDERITGGDDPIELGSNNSGRGVGGSTVHFTMVVAALPAGMVQGALKLGYARDWPVTARRCGLITMKPRRR